LAEFSFVFWLVIAIALFSLVAKRLEIPYPIVMVVGGVLLALFPHVPTITLQPDLIFILVLPILLFAGGWETDWRDFRFNLRPILLLAIGCVVFTTVVVAAVAHAIFPVLTWPAAFVLGAIVAPTDAVAASAIMKAMSVPRRINSILEGESLVNDASSLVIYRFAITAVVAGTFSFGSALASFVVVSIGGIAMGLVTAYLYVRFQKYLNRRGLNDPEIDVLISLLGPFAAYLPADAVGVSGVLAAVAAGIYVSRQAPTIYNSQTRLLAASFWEMLIFILNAMVFVLIGLQLRTVLSQLGGPLLDVIWGGVAISVVVIVVRMIWIYPGTYLPRLLFPQITVREGWPPLTWPTLIGWTGMRGVVSLAAALALPVSAGSAPFPGRNLIIFLTFCVIFATLVLQGLSLPAVIKLLGLREETYVADREEAQARIQVAEAAKARLEELSAADGATELQRTRTAQLSAFYDDRIRHFRSHLQGAAEEERAEIEHEVDHTLRRETLEAERATLVMMRTQNLINDDIYHRIETDIDLAETQLR
jgi:CPA1 family monovalent cation:H+ antiporter